MKLIEKIKYSALLALILFTAACEKDGIVDEASLPGESTTPISATPDEVTNPNQTFAEEFMDLVNDHRSSIGLSSLINDVDMSDMAQKHSADMAKGSVSFGHTGFSSRCSGAKEAIGGGNLCGENVAMGQKTPSSVFTSWMNSPGHRANIEQSRYTHSGFGYLRSASGTYYWTHLFLEEK